MGKSISISVKEKGDFSKTFKFLKAMKEQKFLKSLDKYGQRGVIALSEATPKDSGLTANSWKYEIEVTDSTVNLRWYNTNVVKGYFNVALMLQYGHGTGTGGWVEGIDYINPALEPVFDEILGDMWEEVSSS